MSFVWGSSTSTAVICLLSVYRKKICIKTKDRVGDDGRLLGLFCHLFQTLKLLSQTNSFSCLFDFWFFNILGIIKKNPGKGRLNWFLQYGEVSASVHRNLFSVFLVMSIISNLHNFKTPIQINLFILSMNKMVQVLNKGICSFWYQRKGSLLIVRDESFLDKLVWEKTLCFVVKYCTNELWRDEFWGKLSNFWFKI